MSFRNSQSISGLIAFSICIAFTGGHRRVTLIWKASSSDKSRFEVSQHLPMSHRHESGIRWFCLMNFWSNPVYSNHRFHWFISNRSPIQNNIEVSDHRVIDCHSRRFFFSFDLPKHWIGLHWILLNDIQCHSILDWQGHPISWISNGTSN